MDALTWWISRSPVTGWDALDVLVVALIIYESLKLIRGTRAMQMAFGSALLVRLYFFSLAAPLQTVNWLIRNLIGYVVFAAIVLFQKDIRRALAHFGRARSCGFFAGRERRRDHRRGGDGRGQLADADGGRSSSSSGRSACATTSRAASRSTRW